MKKFGRVIQDYFTSVFGSRNTMETDQQSFVPGEWYILPEQEIDLERLVIFMKENPGMTVELNLHPDYTGAQSSSDQSWQLRAKETLSYLISEGVEKSQLIINSFQLSPLPCFRLKSA